MNYTFPFPRLQFFGSLHLKASVGYSFVSRSLLIKLQVLWSFEIKKSKYKKKVGKIYHHCHFFEEEKKDQEESGRFLYVIIP